MIKRVAWKRVVSAILCIVLFVSSVPLNVIAQDVNTNEQIQQTQQFNNLSPELPNDGEILQSTLNNTLPEDYPQNAVDVLNTLQPQILGVTTERPASIASNTSSLTYEKEYTGSAASGFNGGSGTQSNPYIIKTGAQLKYFANQVNEGNT